MLKHTKRNGLATIAALVVLAVIAATSIIVLQTITAEKQFNSSAFQKQQAETLADDLCRIVQTQKKDAALTIPAAAFHGIADLQLTATVKENTVSATVAYAGDLPVRLRYKAERQQEIP